MVEMYVLVLVRDLLCLFTLSASAVMISKFAVQIDALAFSLSYTMLHAVEVDSCDCFDGLRQLLTTMFSLSKLSG